MEDIDLARFARDLQSEIADKSAGEAEAGEFSENAFVEIVSEHLAEIGALENPVTCHFAGRAGSALVRLAGYAIPDDGERIELMAAIYVAGISVGAVSSTDAARVATQAARAVTYAQRELHEQLEPASDRFAMMRCISEMLIAGVKQVRVILITNAICPLNEQQPVQSGDVTTTFEFYDLRRLLRTMGTSQTREIIDIDLPAMNVPPIRCVRVPGTIEDYETYLAVFPGECLYRMYDAHGPRILEYNVRAFLQAAGKVNRGIRDTIRDLPGYFMAYNNGISVTADEVRTAADGDGLVITGFKGLQIVNGGQTTASIHRARKRDKLDLSRVNVPAKVTRLPADRVDEMVPLISRYANTQNVVQEADFSSNEPFHIALERLSKLIWAPGERTRWFYERSRGQYQTAMNIEGTTAARLRLFRERTPPSQRFTKTDLAKYINSWNRLPHVVSGGNQKNFVAFMRRLRESRGTAWEPDEAWFRDAVAQAILYNTIQRIVRHEAFPAYRQNIVTYLLAFLSHRTAGRIDLNRIWLEQRISSELEGLLRAWSHDVDQEIQKTAAGRNVTEWCKKEACWQAVRSLDLPLDVQPAEWTSLELSSEAEANDSLNADEHAAAASCMQLSAETWFAIQLWGTRTANLARWQAGIANTLSRYAAEGWSRTPTAKQAIQGVKILEIAVSKGFEMPPPSFGTVGAFTAQP